MISKHILHPDELDHLKMHFESQNIKLSSYEHIYELLELQAYYNDSNLIFNVKIPNMYDNQSKLYHIKSIPINITKTIPTPKPYIFMDDYRFEYLDTPCQNIENVYYKVLGG